MKVDYLSDLHIDFYFPKNKKILDEDIKALYHPIITKGNREIGNVLIIAGDIGHYNYQNITILKYLKENYYKHILCVLGNHDYYLLGKGTLNRYNNSFERVEEMRELINNEEGMYCLDGDVVNITGINFAGCDSWYNYGYVKRYFSSSIYSKDKINSLWSQYLNDEKNIYGIDDFDEIWNTEISKIESIYESCDVMVTHVNPSTNNDNIPIQYRNSITNTFFTFEGGKYLKEGNMRYWIFGHTHEQIEYFEHNVKCLCNPFGYPKELSNIRIKSFTIS